MKNIAAVIVTYNRKELLIEALSALVNQTIKLKKIYLIDNNSNDGTYELLHEKGYLANSTINYIKLDKNLGGSGGFYHGIDAANKSDYDWVWILDDDTIPEKDAAEKILEAEEALTIKKVNPSILCSKVNWIDNSLHPMNLPTIDKRDWELLSTGIEFGLMPIRSTSFVSVFIKGDVIREYGLPIKEYFIWNDDVEYTARILKDNPGFFVNNSVVLHKTKLKYTPLEEAGERFFYEVRNKIWMITSTNSWTRYEKLRFVLIILRNIVVYLKFNKFSFKSFKSVIKGAFAGLFKSPKAL
jgi:rhamnopyranosyl-N-acetylglucosaminyl-diphospho-decaprenol beta-1,3/1,4-galactofuranosyltransferase